MWVFNPPSFRADPIGSVFTIRVEGEDDVGLVEFEFELESKFSNVLLLLGEGCSLEFGLDLDLGCDMVFYGQYQYRRSSLTNLYTLKGEDES